MQLQRGPTAKAEVSPDEFNGLVYRRWPTPYSVVFGVSVKSLERRWTQNSLKAQWKDHEEEESKTHHARSDWSPDQQAPRVPSAHSRMVVKSWRRPLSTVNLPTQSVTIGTWNFRTLSMPAAVFKNSLTNWDAIVETLLCCPKSDGLTLMKHLERRRNISMGWYSLSGKRLQEVPSLDTHHQLNQLHPSISQTA